MLRAGKGTAYLPLLEMPNTCAQSSWSSLASPRAHFKTAPGRKVDRAEKPNMFFFYRPNTFDPVWYVLQVNKSRKQVLPTHTPSQ